jgi:hypothetical protein
VGLGATLARPLVAKLREAISAESISLNPELLNVRQLPMVAHPLPWVSHNRGGYFRNTSMPLFGFHTRFVFPAYQQPSTTFQFISFADIPPPFATTH